MGSVRECYLNALSSEVREEEATDDLEQRLLDKWAAGKDAHPTLRVSAEAFAAALGERRRTRPFELDQIFAADLLLAVGALSGDVHALRTLEQVHIVPLRARLGRGRVSGDTIEDALASMRESMLVARGDNAPKLAQYTGQVPLDAWLRVVGERALISQMRKRQGGVPISDGDAQERASDADSPELNALRSEHRALFQHALSNALTHLAPSDRQLLVWLTKENLTIDDIAPRLGVHRATVARMATRLRKTLFDAVRVEIQRRLALSASSLDSLCAQMSPEMNLTLSRVL